MILKDLKEGTQIITFSGIVFTINHTYYGRKYRYTKLVNKYTKESFIRKEIDNIDIYDNNNTKHVKRAKTWQKEHKEYLIKKSKWSFNKSNK